MDDVISRQAAQTELMMKCERYTLARESHGMGHVEWSSDLISVADAMDAIRDLPSVQPEIIHCRDCKHHWTYRCMGDMPTEACELEQTFYDANVDFCSLAERRTDEGSD